MRILAVDDDEGVLELLVSRLSEIGYVPIAARSGTEALQAVQDNPGIRLAILNWMLPGLDGLEVAREFKHAGAEIYTVVLVGRYFCEEVKAGFGSWVDEFVCKPLSYEALQALLARAEAAITPRETPSQTTPPAEQATQRHRMRGFGSGAGIGASQGLGIGRN